MIRWNQGRPVLKSGIHNRTLIQITLPVLLSLLYGAAGVDSQAADFIFFFKQGKRMVPRVTIDQQSYLPLVDLAQILDLSYSESASAGYFQINAGNNLIKLIRGRSLVAVNDQAVVLPVPVAYLSQGWLVHPDFVLRVLNRVLTERFTPDSSGTRFAQGGLNFNRLNVLDTVSAQGSRLTLQFGGPIDLEIRREASRIICSGGNALIDPMKMEFNFKDPAISAVTFEDSPEGSRLLIQLTDSRSPSRITRLTSQNIYLVEVFKPQGSPPAESHTPKPEMPPMAESPRRSHGLRILLDPGHGGEEKGVKLDEANYEKDLVLQMVRRIRTVLQNRMGAEVPVTRNGDESLSLNGRCEMANRLQADLAISLHIGNSNQATEAVSRVYVFKPISGGVEESQNQSPPFIPWGQAQLKPLEHSRLLAELLQNEINQQVNGGDVNVSFRQAPLYFLSCLGMPAVVLEIGNSKRPESIKQMQEANFQDALALAVLTAVDKFRNLQGKR
jgi:N-acetylmuramoyl-L-alanine amidase